MPYHDDFLDRGWLRFPVDSDLAAWAAHARPIAAAAALDPANAHWLRCGGTWFVGVDALPNDHHGQLEDGPPLQGVAIAFIRGNLGLTLPQHRAQVSICYPGYPRPSPEETEAAHLFRLNRDAAHVDGLLSEGPAKRRHLREPHAYILGLPLTEQSADAAPLTVWEGSHHIMRRLFEDSFRNLPPEQWASADVTTAYQAARRVAFASCRRIELPACPGEALLLHRHVLHGVAPWAKAAVAPPEGRITAYFRPGFTCLRDWLETP